MKGCVTESNIKKYEYKTQKQCEAICEKTEGCKGYEFFVKNTNPNVRAINLYKHGDCQPQNDDNIEGCLFEYYQIQFWKKEEYSCTSDEEEED